MICDTESLRGFLKNQVAQDGSHLCAIDTEADSLHRFRESLCLIQFTSGEECVLIDPLVIDDLSPLADYLKTATVWMHGADYDMTMLKREFGEIPPVVYDTQIGARLLGVKKFGLGNLVEHYFDVKLLKSSQKADWGKRPLSEIMIDYALNDVRYLLEMGDKIVAQLKEKNRYQWFLESCVAAREKVDERTDSKEDLWRIPSSGKLDTQGLAALKKLWHWREGEAESWDKPTFMVAPNRVLLEWSQLLADGEKISLPRHYRGDRLKRFWKAVDEFRSTPESGWPTKPKIKRRKKDAAFDKRVDALIARRNEIASELDIDGSLIAARSAIEVIAADEKPANEILMKWQLDLLDP